MSTPPTSPKVHPSAGWAGFAPVTGVDWAINTRTMRSHPTYRRADATSTKVAWSVVDAIRLRGVDIAAGSNLVPIWANALYLFFREREGGRGRMNQTRVWLMFKASPDYQRALVAVCDASPPGMGSVVGVDTWVLNCRHFIRVLLDDHPHVPARRTRRAVAKLARLRALKLGS